MTWLSRLVSIGAAVGSAWLDGGPAAVTGVSVGKAAAVCCEAAGGV